MKKIWLTLVLVLLVSVAIFAEENTPAYETPKAELSLNVFGLFVGSYTARIELPLVSSGLFALGLRGTYNNQEVGTVTLTGVQFLMDARLYPSRSTRGFYIVVEGGYSSYKAVDTYEFIPEETKYSSLPIMAGLGWKWIIQDFSIDLGVAYGKQKYLDAPASNIIDYEQFPFNIAFDIYLLVGYRF